MSFFSKSSFYTRNQISMFIFILLPMGVLSFGSYFVMKDVVLEKVQNSRQNVLEVIAGDINKNIEDIIYASNLFAYQEGTVYEDLVAFKNVSKIESLADLQRYTRISEVLDLAFSKTTGLGVQVFFVNKGKLQIDVAGVIPVDYQILDGTINELWKREANPTRIYWMNHMETEHYYFVKILKKYQSDDYIGVLYVGLPYVYFERLFSGVGTGQLALKDQDGNLIFNYTGEQMHLSEGKQMQVNAHVPKTGWELTYEFSSKEITDEITHVFKYYILLLVICIIVFILISIVLARRLYRPLLKLKNTAEQFGDGNLLVRFPVRGQDEFAILGNAFNTMLDQIKKLIEDVHQEQEEKRILELEALFSQIQPHFLMNTLNSIKIELLLSKDDVHGKQVEALMNLLRAYMKMNEMISLEQECSLLHDYVNIMKLRSGLQVALNLELPTTLEHFEVPRLFLQPFVENAIVHGFAQSDQLGKIAVIIRLVAHHIEIVIEDNGVGMSDEKISALKYMMDAKQEMDYEKGVGLHNTLRRLQLVYGQGVSLDFFRNNEDGMTFRLLLPYNGKR